MNQLIKSSQEAISIGETFYKSGMFPDIKSAQQAIVKIMAGAEMGISPFQAMSGIHIIQGRPTIGAGLMASRVKASGKYNYRILKMDSAICEIEFFEGGISIGVSSFSAEDAKKAGTKNLDKFPRNMLFARAMSNGVRWYCPDIYEGPVYVPEEMEDIPHTEVVKKSLNDEQFKRLVDLIKENGEVNGQPALDWTYQNINLTENQSNELANL